MILKNSFYSATSALRDFFIAQDNSSMKKAVSMMNESLTFRLVRVQNWKHIEYSFNRLFVGPMALEAPPYASLYLETEPVVMGKTTMFARAAYETMGLVSPWKNMLPEDHVSLELDAVMIMHQYKEHKEPNGVSSLRNYFVNDHMQSWVPLFCQRIKDSESGHPVIKEIADILLTWLDAEKTHWSYLDDPG